MITVPNVYQAVAIQRQAGKRRVVAKRFFRCRRSDPRTVGRAALRGSVTGPYELQIRPVQPHQLGMKELPARLQVAA